MADLPPAGRPPAPSPQSPLNELEAKYNDWARAYLKRQAEAQAEADKASNPLGLPRSGLNTGQLAMKFAPQLLGGDPLIGNGPTAIIQSDATPAAKPASGPAPDISFVETRGDGPAPSPRMIPAGEVPLVDPKRQETEQETYDAQQRAVIAQRAALGEQKDAEDEIAQARVQQNNAKAEGEQRVADTARNAGIDTQARALSDKEEQSAFRSKMNAFSDDLAKERIAVDASLPRQVTWGLAKAFGAIAQGMLNLPTNQIADGIDAQIKQEIENQKANHGIKRDRLKDMQNFYDHAVSQSKDQAERMRLAQGYALEAAKAEALSLAHASGNPLALAEAKKINAALDEKAGQLEEHQAVVATAAAQRSIAENKWVPARVEGGGGGGKHADGKFVYFDPTDGKYYDAKSEPNHKELTKAVLLQQRASAAGQKYLDTLKGLGFFEKLAGKGEIDSKAMSAARGAHIAYLDDVREINAEGGVIREGLKKAGVYEHSIVSPDKLTGDAESQIRVTLDRVKNLSAETKRILDPTPVVKAPQGYGTAPKNEPTGRAYKAPRKVTPESVGATPVGAKAKGGDVDHAQPYLVGEEGPELVVPNKPGFVLTALQTAALRGAPPTRQQMDTLPSGAKKSAIQRYAEREGVAREEGGAVKSPKQPTPEELAEDERQIREFMGPAGVEKVRTKTAEEAAWDRQKAEYENREGERIERLAREEAARKNAEAERQRPAIQKYADWVLQHRAKSDQEFAQRKAAGQLGPLERYADDVTTRTSAPEMMPQTGWRKDVEDRLIRAQQEDFEAHPERYDDNPGLIRRIAAKAFRGLQPRTRQPVSFERDLPPAGPPPPPPPARAEGGEIIPLYEPPGQYLQQTPDGKAYFASDAAPSQGASLSGPTPRHSAHAPIQAKAAPAALPSPRRRPQTPEELMRAADEMKAQMRESHESRMAQGPAVSARAKGGAMPPKGLAASLSRDFKKAKRAG